MIFIIPVGFDYQRIVDGLKEMRERYEERIKKIYFLQHFKEIENTMTFRYSSKENIEDLKEKFPSDFYEIKTVKYDPTDYENVFYTIFKILKMETPKDQEIWIDVTSTSRIAMCFIISLSYLFPKTHVYMTPFKHPREYPDPEKDKKEFDKFFIEERKREGKSPIEIFLSGERIDLPSEKELEILRILKGCGGEIESKTNLIKKCESGKDPHKDKNMQSKYGTLTRELETMKYIKIEKKGRKNNIKLTKWGELLIKAFEKSKK